MKHLKLITLLLSLLIATPMITSCEEDNPFNPKDPTTDGTIGGEEAEGDNNGEGTGDETLEIEMLDILAEIEKDEMVFVQGGSYNMGATEEQGSDAKADESPIHLVMLSDYHISRYEVTQKFWETIMGENPSRVKGENLPVDNVSWEDCQQFIRLLNQRTDKNFSLPTEAEWEYAARGGKDRTGTKYSGSNNAEEVAWSDAIDGTIQPVGTKKYNELGIFDMSGNVSEWCYDWYGAYTNQEQTNPIGAETGTKRVLRGGNISSPTIYSRVSARNSLTQEEKQSKTGFRIVLSKPCYLVNVSTSSEKLGSVTINNTTKEQYVKEGVQVTLEAIAKENCNFHNWTVNGKEVSKENPYTTTITGDTEFKANFITHKVSVIAGEGGKAEISKTQVENNGEITLSATPNEGYSFVNWTVNGKEVSKKNPYTTTITGDTEFKANFISHKVTVISGEGGTAMTNKKQVGHNGQVILTATPNEGYGFVNWTVNGEEVSKNNPYKAIITGDTEFKANFISHKVTVISGEGGTAITNKKQVGHNGQVTLTATPNEGYSFVNWTVNGKEVSKENPYTIKIIEDKEFKANFISHKVTVISGEGGTAITNKKQVGHNEEVTLTATPNEDYSFVNWTVNGEEVSKNNPYEAIITGDTEFKANFITHKVTVIAEEGGTAKANKTNVKHDGWVTLTATPDEGYYFLYWKVNNAVISSENPYSLRISSDSEFKACFVTYEPTGMENNRGYVDLGLSVKWATCNIGGSMIGWGGYRYAWGEDKTKYEYTMENYYYKSYPSTLPSSNDAAHVNWGGSWRIPTKAEFSELLDSKNCEWRWMKVNEIEGYKVTSKINGNSIFLPVGLEKDVYYWSSSSSNLGLAYCLRMKSSYKGIDHMEKYKGLYIRPVCE